MTVKDIFELRKKGRFEEAYEAIRPLYAAHRGRYTTQCMFWTASDVFKLRLEQGRVEEAAKILQALKRMQPQVEYYEVLSGRIGAAAAFIAHAEHRLSPSVPAGSSAAAFPAGFHAGLAAPAEATVPAGSPAEPLNKGQQAVLDCIKAHPGLKVPGIEAETGTCSPLPVVSR